MNETPRALVGDVKREAEWAARSSSGKKEYRMRTVGGKVVGCSCPGWFYRGGCRHARELEAHLAAYRRLT